MSETYPELDPERNERTCRLIMISIAKYPQSLESDYLLADEVLGAFDSVDDTAIDLRDVARVKPSKFTGLEGIVHSIHAKFGIQSRPGAGIVGYHVRDTAKNALLAVHYETIDASFELGKQIPDEIKKFDAMLMNTAFSPHIGYVLFEHLSEDPELRGFTAGAVNRMADKRRREGHRYQRYLASRE